MSTNFLYALLALLAFALLAMVVILREERRRPVESVVEEALDDDDPFVPGEKVDVYLTIRDFGEAFGQMRYRWAVHVPMPTIYGTIIDAVSQYMLLPVSDAQVVEGLAPDDVVLRLGNAPTKEQAEADGMSWVLHTFADHEGEFSLISLGVQE